MAKGGSEPAVHGLECQEVAGEHRRAVAEPDEAELRVLEIQTQAASMGDRRSSSSVR